MGKEREGLKVKILHLVIFGKWKNERNQDNYKDFDTSKWKDSLVIYWEEKCEELV